MALIKLEKEIDPVDYISEIDIDDLVDEIKKKGHNYIEDLDTDKLILELESLGYRVFDEDIILYVLPEHQTAPIRNILIDIFDLGIGASIEDIQNAVKENYYK
jgi:hypothetical protein